MSGLKIRWGGATVTPSQVKVRSGGAWADSAAVWVRDGGAWVKVWPASSPLSASASPNPLTALRIGSGSLSKSTTVNASGGVPPYSYSTIWSSGGSGLSISNATTATPTVSGNTSPTTTLSGTLRCRVTDSAATTYDVFVPVAFDWEP